MMAETLTEIHQMLKQSGHPFEIMACDASLADTALFCEHYGIPLEVSANTILIRSKTGERKFAACVLLANHRLDVNHTVRKKLGARKVSFASAEETRELTGMELGGVTPLALPEDLPVWVDQSVMECEYIILGGGNRTSKLKVNPLILQSVKTVEVVEGLSFSRD